MSESQSVQLSMLSKEDFKKLAKQAEKAKRDENAKQAKISTPYDPTMPANVSFDAPVKVSEDRDDKLLGVLGPYENMSSLIMRQDKYFVDMVGVERQPTTPFPRKQGSQGFFPKPGSSNRSAQYSQSSEKTSSSNSRPHKTSASDQGSANKSDARYKSANATASVPDVKNKPVSMGHSANVGNDPGTSSNKVPHSVDRSDTKPVTNTNINKSDPKIESSANDPRPVQSSFHKPSESDRTLDQSARRENVSQSVKHAPISNREPVLDSLKQELIGQSKSNNSSDRTQNSSKASECSSERSGKKPQGLDGRSVLQVKEENTNGAVVNGAKLKHKPKLHIPENVEEMLKEFQLPQPLTGIQTPFKESKFPFQEKIQDRKESNLSQTKELSKGKEMPLSSMAPRLSAEGNVRIVEEIQEKDSSSSSSSSGSDSDSGSTSDDSDNSDEEEGDEHDDKDGGIDLDEMINSHDNVSEDVKQMAARPAEKRDHRGRTVLAQKVPPLGTDSASVLPKDSAAKRMHDSCSSSESSSSSSESGSDTGSDSESDKDLSDEEPPHHTPQSTPSKLKNSPEDLESSASPASKKWGLKSFLQEPLPSFNLEKKPSSCEAPASDKSEPDHDDEVTDLKRGADHISDENPPSNDQDIMCKPMSADEFSPPASLEHKHSVLSPIKTPPPVAMKSPIPAVKSPIKSFHRNKTAEKFHKSPRTDTDFTVSLGKSSENCKFNPLTKSPVKASPAHRVRKSKKNYKSVEHIESSDSEIESEIDVVNCSHSSESALDSPQKPLPVNSQQNSQPLDSSVCSSKPSTSSAKRKESKRDKLLKEKDLVKLKNSDVLSGVSSKSSCDSRKGAVSVSARSFTDPIEDMLHTFPGEKPLSPIPNVPSKQDSYSDQLRRAGLAVSPVRRIPSQSRISYAVEPASVLVKVEPASVLVKIDLNLLAKVLCIDSNSQDFLKPKPLQELHRNHQKLTSAKTILPDEGKSQKVLANAAQDKFFKSSASTPSANSVVEDISGRKYKADKRSSLNSSFIKEAKTNKNNISEIPDFDSLPISTRNESLSEHSVQSDSSDGESDAEQSNNVVSLSSSISASGPSSFSPSPLEKKKRKIETSRDDDSKRRKTLSKTPVHQPAFDPAKSETIVDVSSGVKRERHNSTSSQHSNVSMRSTHSQQSLNSRRGHKRSQTQEEGLSKTLKSSSSSSSLCLDRSKSTAVVTPVVKNEVKIDLMDTSRLLNGFAGETAMHHPLAVSLHQSVLKDREEETKMLSADDYHRQAKKYKYQADDMEGCLAKYVLYLESVLCFLQCGYAMEKHHMITEASNMYKDTYKFVSHQYHQFRMMHDADSSDKAQKLTVLCLRIQSLIYLKLYMLKKAETVKLKRILEENSKSIKSTPQPKAPSAPSPHQPSWNRSTGTPSPMSPTPSPANSVCSVGSVGSDITPSKLSNGTSGQTQIVPPGSVIVSQRIHSITQKYFSNTCYLIQAHELWDQANIQAARDSREFFAQLDLDCGPLTLHSSLLHLVRYVRQGITRLNL